MSQEMSCTIFRTSTSICNNIGWRISLDLCCWSGTKVSYWA